MKKIFQSRSDSADAPPRRPSKLIPVTEETAGDDKKGKPFNTMTDEEKVQALITKLKTANRQASVMTDDALKVFAMSLALEEQIKNKYLNPEIANTIAVVCGSFLSYFPKKKNKNKNKTSKNKK